LQLSHVAKSEGPSGGSGILAFILVLLLQGWYVLKIPSKLNHDSKKKEESRKTERKRRKLEKEKKELEANWRRLKKFRENWRQFLKKVLQRPKMVFREL
jgi:uncharacterized protein YlxW (UPF0749 family)